MCIGIGTGAMALVFGAIVANRWFHTQRGLVTGIFSAANATGQLLFLPLIARTAETSGWRAAAGIVACSPCSWPRSSWPCCATGPPTRVLPYGMEPCNGRRRDPIRRLAGAGGGRRGRGRGPALGLLGPVLTFWVCGWSTNGIIQTHFVPAAHDHGMPSTTAAGLLAVVGIFDIAGTIASGWLTDRVDPRWLLVAYYGGRGFSLLALDLVLAPGMEPGMWVFIVFYGLDWVATVPPTVALCRMHFGLGDSGVVFGWVFASHMVGAGVGASVAGWVRTSQGDYHWAWVVAAALCFASVAITLSIPRMREGRRT